ncbi:hypothetical protein FOCC_FOCC006034 [Frankliniella occidentalis]|nr:hypothetical protein FOCC_FOCC006034 [Frankliniella occidentalis]
MGFVVLSVTAERLRTNSVHRAHSRVGAVYIEGILEMGIVLKLATLKSNVFLPYCFSRRSDGRGGVCRARRTRRVAGGSGQLGGGAGGGGRPAAPDARLLAPAAVPRRASGHLRHQERPRHAAVLGHQRASGLLQVLERGQVGDPPAGVCGPARRRAARGGLGERDAPGRGGVLWREVHVHVHRVVLAGQDPLPPGRRPVRL